MKRYLVVAVALVLVVSLGLALTGCGGDASKAKEYIENADAIIEEVEENSGKMEAQFQAIGTALKGENITSAETDELAKGLADATDSLIADAKKAAAELQKVAGLEGVEDYQEYAELRISVIDGIIELIEITEKYLVELSQALAAVEVGQAIDQDKFLAESNAYAEKMVELQKIITTNGEKADEIQKNL